ncbi:hypothetical protein GXW78_11845 [Roseomonas terrae]|uniref:Uncharacterized protein n=1 Tax=Neoroseomonas terrae TaxID=424799 RepID=A0ABS5EH51_9PROT|nr:hypothetical protein [Neoroseomonas terrae]
MDLFSALAQQVQASRRAAPAAQPQPSQLVINVGEGGVMTLIMGGSASTTVSQLKS